MTWKGVRSNSFFITGYITRRDGVRNKYHYFAVSKGGVKKKKIVENSIKRGDGSVSDFPLRKKK